MHFFECAVGIPAYEDAAGLTQTLHCLNLQSVQNFQVVILDDSRDDKVEEVVRQVQNTPHTFLGSHRLNYDRIKYIRRGARLGFRVASAWNIIWRSTDIAPDSVMILTNSHILMDEWWVERHLAHHQDADNRLVVGPFKDNTWEGASTRGRWESEGPEKRHLLLRCYSDSLRKKHLAAVGGWDEDFDGEWGFEDVDVAWRLEEYGMEFVHGIDVEVVHLRHSVTHPAPTDQKLGARNVRLLAEKHPSFQGMAERWLASSTP